MRKKKYLEFSLNIADQLNLNNPYSAIVYSGAGEKYYKRAREAVLGTGTLPGLFAAAGYIESYMVLKSFGILSDEDCKITENKVELMLNGIFTGGDLGNHNRTADRAAALIMGVKAFPENLNVKRWQEMAEHILSETLGQWSIEDSTIYLPLWLSSLIEISEITGKELYSHILFYYCRYIQKLLSPYGTVPEFGDAHFGVSWTRFTAIMEYGAKKFNNPYFKHTAEIIFETMSRIDNQPCERLLRICAHLILAYRWADDEIKPLKPLLETGEALDDIIGKKIVFRTEAAYMLLNYRDVPDGSYLTKCTVNNNLRVREEKPHHGHSDENSICLLMHNGTVLLRGSGYRDSLSQADGAYRGDIYHNTCIIRSKKYDGGGMPEFLKDGGIYKYPKTKKLYYKNFNNIEVSKTRAVYYDCHTIFDRCIIHFKEQAFFVIADILRAAKDGDYTYVPMFHTKEYEKKPDGSYITWYPCISSGEFPDGIPNGGNEKLTLRFVNRKGGEYTVRRNYTDETTIYQYFSGCLKKDEVVCFASVLSTAGHTPSVEFENGSLVVDKDYHIALRTKEAPLNYERLPRYSFDTGKEEYGRILTDAEFAFCRENGSFGFVSASRIDFDGKVLFETQPTDFKQYDLQFSQGSCKWHFHEED